MKSPDVKKIKATISQIQARFGVSATPFYHEDEDTWAVALTDSGVYLSDDFLAFQNAAVLPDGSANDVMLLLLNQHMVRDNFNRFGINYFYTISARISMHGAVIASKIRDFQSVAHFQLRYFTPAVPQEPSPYSVSFFTASSSEISQDLVPWSPIDEPSATSLVAC